MIFDEQVDGESHGECATEIHRLEQQCEALAAQVDVMLDALLKLCESADDSDGCQYGTLSTHFVRDICAEALALPNTAATILRQRDARVLREAADVCAGMFEGQVGAVHVASMRCADALRDRADELENGK